MRQIILGTRWPASCLAGEPSWATLNPFAPGIDPVAALLRELANAARTTPLHVRQCLDHDDGLVRAVEEVLCVSVSQPRRLLVVIDQFEEVLTRSSPTSRARLATLLRPAVVGPVQVAVTIRSEFLDPLLADPDMAALPVHVVTLRPLQTAILPHVIQGPARLAGLTVDPELVSRMVADTASGDALPLLAFTLEQLAMGLSRGAMLSPERYEQLGGVQGAVMRQADAALADALAVGRRRRTDVVAALLQLVTVDEVGQPTRLEISYKQLPPPVRMELDAFIAQRLLTTSEREGIVLLAVAHEAFLTAWPPLVQAITSAESALRMRRMLEQATAEWEKEGRSSSFLWGGGRLAAAISESEAQLRRVHPIQPGGGALPTGRLRALHTRHELTSGRVELNLPIRAFLRASIRHQQFRRSLFFTAVVVVVIVAITITSIAVFQRQIAQDQRELATVRGLIAQAEARRSSDIRLSLQLGVAAHQIRPSVETGTSLYATLISTLLTATLTGHASYVNAVAFSPDGHTLATASSDTTTALWNLRGLLKMSGHLTELSCAAAGGGLARARWDSVALGIPYLPTC